MNSSIVEELERDTLNSKIPISDLLRKVKVIASKLDLQQPQVWVDSELSGYPPDNVPSYRVVTGQAKFRNPIHGWQPILFGDQDTEKKVCELRIINPVKEIEHLIAEDGKPVVYLSGEKSSAICRLAGVPPMQVALFISLNSMVNVLDSVRNKILDWVLNLNKAGIKGEGLSFTAGEKAVAQSPSVIYNIKSIGSITGNVGGHVGRDVIAFSKTDTIDVQAITKLVEQIRAHENQMGLTPLQQEEMRGHIDALDAEIQKTAPERGKLAHLLQSVKAAAEGAAGNLIASGVVALAAKILTG